mmetsp:Transcript_19671/g.54629  ORF Transcript_19671/g.54629 Transcript_19671/m.54629 type:complete len:220 (-) Transcript_19671:943-1602(-)
MTQSSSSKAQWLARGLSRGWGFITCCLPHPPAATTLGHGLISHQSCPLQAAGRHTLAGRDPGPEPHPEGPQAWAALHSCSPPPPPLAALPPPVRVSLNGGGAAAPRGCPAAHPGKHGNLGRILGCLPARFLPPPGCLPRRARRLPRHGRGRAAASQATRLVQTLLKGLGHRAPPAWRPPLSAKSGVPINQMCKGVCRWCWRPVGATRQLRSCCWSMEVK